jgi:hypothetical protein
MAVADPANAWWNWGMAANWQANPSPGSFTAPVDPEPPSNHMAVQAEPGGVRLRYSGVPGARCEVQRSLDLVRWDVVSEMIVPQHGLVEVKQPLSPDGSVYFRVRAISGL